MLVKHIVTFFMLVMAPDFPAHQEKKQGVVQIQLDSSFRTIPVCITLFDAARHYCPEN